MPRPAKQARVAATSTAIVLSKPSRPLTKAEHAILAEALQRGDAAHKAVESAVIDYGRWLLVQVFADDAGAALTRRRENVLWRELLARAGGPTLRVSSRFLNVAITIAGHDKRIQDDAWRLLDAGRKELLLPLREPIEMRKAAQHVVAMKLSQRKTRDYVRALRQAKADPRRARVTAPAFENRLQRFRERVTDAGFVKAAEQALRALPRASRGPVRKELETLRGWINSMLAVVRA